MACNVKGAPIYWQWHVGGQDNAISSSCKLVATMWAVKSRFGTYGVTCYNQNLLYYSQVSGPTDRPTLRRVSR
jgi:hypothetical protein